jgi:hypothetical protein
MKRGFAMSHLYAQHSAQTAIGSRSETLDVFECHCLAVATKQCRACAELENVALQTYSI